MFLQGQVLAFTSTNNKLEMVGTAKGLKIIHLNCRSILPKWEELRNTFLKCNTDILIFTETWLHKNVNSSLLYDDNYTITRLDRQAKLPSGLAKRGGGICIMTRKDLVVDMENCVSISNKDIELLHINVKKGMSRRINVVGVYRPPTGQLSSALEILDKSVKEIKSNFKGELCYIGDYNIDFSKRDRASTSLKDWGKNSGLTQLITDTTRETGSTSSQIDLIFTDIDFIIDSGVIDYSTSDHFPIYLVKKKVREVKDTTTIRCRRFRDFDLDAFCADLRQLDQADPNHTDVNLTWELMWKNIVTVCDKHCPYVTFTARCKPDYITDDLLRKMRVRDTAFKHAHRTKNSADLATAKALRQELTRDLRRAKRVYIQTQLDLSVGNPKRFWKVINKNFFTKGTVIMSKIFEQTSDKLLQGFEASEFINNYFCQISETMATNFGPVPDYDFTESNPLPDWDWTPTISVTDVTKAVKEINIDKASGFSEVNSKLLKHALLCLVSTFTRLLNSCIEQRRFPELWKSATVVVIPKKGNSKLPSNLRPISLIPIPGKLLEVFMNKFLTQFMEVNGLYTDCQMGFRKERSTLESCFTVVKDVLDSSNDGMYSIAIYIDLSKAFNTVNHSILIQKLIEYQLPTNFIELMVSYLSHRKQKTIFNGVTSNENIIMDGVPQGSVLGLTLFLCYINDLVNQELGCKLGLYADDTILYLSGRHVPELILNLNLIMKKLEQWCFQNRLTINVSKTKAMLFGNTRLLKQINYDDYKDKLVLNGLSLEFVSSYVYLGVTLDQELSFKPHISKMAGICVEKIFTLSKIRKFISLEVALKLYKSLILPIIDYGDVLYIGAPKSEVRKVQMLQNRALRIVKLATRYSSVTELHKAFSVLPLYMRRENNLLKLIHKYLLHRVNDNELPWLAADGDNHIILDNHIRSTRQTSAPYLPLQFQKHLSIGIRVLIRDHNYG